MLRKWILPRFLSRRGIFAVAALFMVFGGSNTAWAVELKLSHIRPQGTAADHALRAFATAVGKATDGGLTVEIFPASMLGDYTVVQERVALGAVDMALQPAATGVDRRMQIATLPYLVENWADARRVYGSGGVIHRTVKDLYARQGITMLASYPVYFGGISLNRSLPPDTGFSPGSRIKIRVPGVKSFQLLGDALGYTPYPIPFAESFSAVQTGLVDGVLGSGAEGYHASFLDVTKTYIPLNTHFEIWHMIINSDRFRQLTEGQRRALSEAARALEAARWRQAEADQDAQEKRLAAAGAVIRPVSAGELATIAKTVRRIVWPRIFQDMGEEWARGILKEVARD